MNNPKTPTKKELEMAANVRRFVEILEMLDFQRTTFQYNLKSEVKMKFNHFFGHLNTIRQELHRFFKPEHQEHLDNRAAFLWEIYDEVGKAKDPRMVLAVIQCYNEGLISLEGQIGTPVNSLTLQDIMDKKQEVLAESA